MTENADFWAQRPMDDIQLQYAAEDVETLLYSWFNFARVATD